MKQNIQELWNHSKRCYKCAIEIPEGGKKREEGTEEILEAIMAETLLMSDAKPKTQEG